MQIFSKDDTRNLFMYWTGKEYKLIKILRELIYIHSKNGNGYTVNLINQDNIKQYLHTVPDYFYNLLPANQADYVRVNVICNYGGIWLDSDTIIIDSLDSLFDIVNKKDGFFIKENGDNGVLWNGIFGSKKDTLLMKKWKKKMIDILDDKKQKIGWTEIGNHMLENIKNNSPEVYSNYSIFNGLDNLYPINWNKCVSEFIEKPYENYKNIVRSYQPLVVLVNTVYKRLEDMTYNEILEGNMPLNYFINKSYENLEKVKNNYKNILITPSKTGRLCNEILNTIIAVYYGLQHNYDYIITNENPPFLNKKIIYLHNNYTETIKLKTNKFAHKKQLNNFWDYNFKDFNMKKTKNQMINKIKHYYKFPKPTTYDEEILHIHIRSGDIMNENGGCDMVQPPCIYYINEIERKKWKKVIIVSEDTKNPCIEYLVNKYNYVIYFGKNSLETDIAELLKATNIMIGRGTFMPILALFMPFLQYLHYPNDGDDRMHYFISVHFPIQNVKHDEYSDYYKKIKEIGGWNWNYEISNLMMSYHKNIDKINYKNIFTNIYQTRVDASNDYFIDRCF